MGGRVDVLGSMPVRGYMEVSGGGYEPVEEVAEGGVPLELGNPKGPFVYEGMSRTITLLIRTYVDVVKKSDLGEDIWNVLCKIELGMGQRR